MIGRFSIGYSLDMSLVDHSMGPDQKKMSLMIYFIFHHLSAYKNHLTEKVLFSTYIMF